MELKLLSLVMSEGVRLGHVEANPLARLKIRRDKPAKKPELTDQDVIEISTALSRRSRKRRNTSSLRPGFHSGAQVTVNNPIPGVIELRVCSPVQMDASFFTAMKQLDAVLK